MRLARDLIVAGATSAFNVLVALAAVPVFVAALGTEGYGLVGFAATLQALLQVFDFGLAATVNRETARRRALGDAAPAGALRPAARITWTVALVQGLGVALLSGWIAAGWLQASGRGPHELARVVALTGLLLACRWPLALYTGAAMGAGRVAAVSVLGAAAALLQFGGGALLVGLWAPHVEALLLWYAGVALLQVGAVRRLLRPFVGVRPGPPAPLPWRFAAGMTAVALVGTLLGQLDRLVVSAALPLERFGEYMLATSLVAALGVLVTPTFNTLFPRLSELLAGGRIGEAEAVYVSGTRALASLLFPLAAVLAWHGETILAAWLRDAVLARHVAPLLALLAAGSALHGVMHVPYALQLAAGRTDLAARLALLLLVVMAALLAWLTPRYGAQGAAAAWLVVHGLYLLLGLPVTARAQPGLRQGRWLLHGVLLPLLLGAGPVLAAGWLLRDAPAAAQLAGAAAALLAGGAASALGHAPIRRQLRAVLRSAGLRSRLAG